MRPIMSLIAPSVTIPDGFFWSVGMDMSLVCQTRSGPIPSLDATDQRVRETCAHLSASRTPPYSARRPAFSSISSRVRVFPGSPFGSATRCLRTVPSFSVTDTFPIQDAGYFFSTSGSKAISILFMNDLARSFSRMPSNSAMPARRWIAINANVAGIENFA